MMTHAVLAPLAPTDALPPRASTDWQQCWPRRRNAPQVSGMKIIPLLQPRPW